MKTWCDASRGHKAILFRICNGALATEHIFLIGISEEVITLMEVHFLFTGPLQHGRRLQERSCTEQRLRFKALGDGNLGHRLLFTR